MSLLKSKLSLPKKLSTKMIETSEAPVRVKAKLLHWGKRLIQSQQKTNHVYTQKTKNKTATNNPSTTQKRISSISARAASCQKLQQKTKPTVKSGRQAPSSREAKPYAHNGKNATKTKLSVFSPSSGFCGCGYSGPVSIKVLRGRVRPLEALRLRRLATSAWTLVATALSFVVQRAFSDMVVIFRGRRKRNFVLWQYKVDFSQQAQGIGAFYFQKIFCTSGAAVRAGNARQLVLFLYESPVK